MTESDPDAVRRGLPNLLRHISNVKKYGVPLVIALNLFPSDTEEEKKVIYEACEDAGVQVADSDVFAFGGKERLNWGGRF